MTITHPHAITALRLARIMPRTPRSSITLQLAASGCPRSLYTLACVLRAATRPGAIINEVA